MLGWPWLYTCSNFLLFLRLMLWMILLTLSTSRKLKQGMPFRMLATFLIFYLRATSRHAMILLYLNNSKIVSLFWQMQVCTNV